MSIADELEKLDQLRVREVISNEEFEREKAKVLGTGSNATAATASQTSGQSSEKEIPFYRKPLFLLALIVLVPPALLIVLWTGPIYRRDNPTKQYVPFSLGWKIFFSVFALFWLLKWVTFFFGT